eukprot:11976793-Alexandrium_andersonii.AAC.1
MAVRLECAQSVSLPAGACDASGYTACLVAWLAAHGTNGWHRHSLRSLARTDAAQCLTHPAGPRA